MRALRVLGTSVVVHAGAFAILMRWHAVMPVPVFVAPVTVTVVAPAPPTEAIEIAFAADRPAPASTAVASGSLVQRHASAAESSGPPTAPSVVSAPTAGTAGTAGPVDAPAAPKRGLGMRGPELHPSDEALAHIADAPGHVGTTAHSAIDLDSAPNGRQTLHVPGTAIIVERDGAAHFHDDADIDAEFKLTPSALASEANELKAHTALWLADPEAFKQAGRPQDLPRHLQGTEGSCGWGDPLCDANDTGTHEKLSRKTNGFTRLPILAGNLDITSYLMRKLHVGDPLASKKLQLLDATRDQRAERGAAYKQEQLDRAAIAMQQNLERLWASTRNADERRAVLFELWDECAEGDTPIGIAGDRARAMIIGWIRAHAVFTPAQIAELDARRTSTQHFAP